MTKKHFRLLAAAIREVKIRQAVDGLDPAHNVAVLDLQRSIAEVCEACNPRFDQKAFRSACDPVVNP